MVVTIIIHWAATAGYPEMITAVITFEIVVSLHKGRQLYLAREIWIAFVELFIDKHSFE